ncbi:MAG TPA: flagellar motor switch protein FliG [Patescibacteria group bacterium]|nr:flagellar motor switch protein FliG [Patescibacteria group bacterium]
MRVREDYRTLTGPEKAAIFLLSLGEEYTAKVFEHMDDEEIMEISTTMANLGKVSANVVERLFVDFADQMSSTNALIGTMDSTERLLTKVLGQEKVTQIMEEIRGPAGRTMWEKLGNVNEEVLANFLQKEYPQTVAVVMSKIQPDHAARVLAMLPENFALEVIQRMLRMETVQKEVLEDVERTLRSEFMSNLARTQRRDSHEMMAEIFNSLERSVETKFMEELEKSVPESAEKIRSLMFTFEDLVKLDPTAIQTIIRAVDKEKLPIALKGATETLRDLFFSNMSERAAKIMKEEMASMGPVRLRDVEEAQQVIVATTKDLEARGEIAIASGAEEDELIY